MLKPTLHLIRLGERYSSLLRVRYAVQPPVPPAVQPPAPPAVQPHEDIINLLSSTQFRHVLLINYLLSL